MDIDSKKTTKLKENETVNKDKNEVLDSDINEGYDDFVNVYTVNKDKPFKIIFNFFSGNRINLFKSMFFLAGKESIVWILPIILANIINIATNSDPSGVRNIIINICVAILFLILNLGSAYCYASVFFKMIRRIEGKLRGTMVKKYQQLSIRFHNKTQSGRLQSKIMRDVENIEIFLNQSFSSVFSMMLTTTVIVCITLYRSPIVLIFFVISIPIAVFTVSLFKKTLRTKNSEYRQELEQTQAAVSEMLEMIPVTRAHGLQDVEELKMTNRLSSIVTKGYRLDKTNMLFGTTGWVVFQTFQVLCLGFTGYLAYKKMISVGEVILYQNYFSQMVNQVSNLVNIYPNLSKGIESVRSIAEVLAEPDIEKNNAILPLENMKGTVEFRDVGFRYNNKSRLVLDGINLKVEAGESIAFVGDSGSGKSTILNLLIGFDRPQRGRILVDGINMINLDMNQYRSNIAVVPQSVILFSGTIRENITYGIDNVIDKDILSVIKDVGLDDLVSELPEGIDTLLGEHGGTLSGGQRQRISIARALIRNPKLIIFDEATSALDSVSEKKVQNATEKMMKKSTTFLVAHRLSTIKNADRIAYIEDGKITEIGTFHELMEKKGKFYNLKMLQN